MHLKTIKLCSHHIDVVMVSKFIFSPNRNLLNSLLVINCSSTFIEWSNKIKYMSALSFIRIYSFRWSNIKLLLFLFWRIFSQIYCLTSWVFAEIRQKNIELGFCIEKIIENNSIWKNKQSQLVVNFDPLPMKVQGFSSSVWKNPVFSSVHSVIGKIYVKTNVS